MDNNVLRGSSWDFKRFLEIYRDFKGYYGIKGDFEGS